MHFAISTKRFVEKGCGSGSLNILVIPTTDWLRHPVPSRHHFIFERLGRRHHVYVVHFNVFPRRKINRDPRNVEILEFPTLTSSDLIAFYTFNSSLHALSILKAIKRLNVDIVFSAQLFHGISGSLGSRINHRVSMFDLCDYFPESASVYYANKSDVYKRLIEATVYRLVQLNLRLSICCIAPSLPLAQLIYQMSHGARIGHLIPNGVDTALFRPMDREDSLADRYRISKNAIGYVGSIETWLDFDTVLGGLRELVKNVPDAQLVMVGSGIKTNYHRIIRQKAISLGLDEHVIEIGTVPYEDLPLYLSTLKACLIPFRTDLFLSRIALPNKFFEYLACGKPILSTPLPEIKRVSKNGVLFYRNEHEFCAKANALLSGSINSSDLTKRNMRLAQMFDWNVAASKLETLMIKTIEEQ